MQPCTTWLSFSFPFARTPVPAPRVIIPTPSPILILILAPNALGEQRGLPQPPQQEHEPNLRARVQLIYGLG